MLRKYIVNACTFMLIQMKAEDKDDGKFKIPCCLCISKMAYVTNGNSCRLGDSIWRGILFWPLVHDNRGVRHWVFRYWSQDFKVAAQCAGQWWKIPKNTFFAKITSSISKKLPFEPLQVLKHRYKMLFWATFCSVPQNRYDGEILRRKHLKVWFPHGFGDFQ